MSLRNGQELDLLTYENRNPQLFFESDWDRELFDETTHDTDDLRPTDYNSPNAFCKILGRLRKQPIFERFIFLSSGKVVIKLLESRLYRLCIEFIFQQLRSNPSAFNFSSYNLRDWNSVPKKYVIKLLCALFDQGNTIIVYNIHKQKIYGVLIAGTYPLEDDTPCNKLLSEFVSDSTHCKEKFSYVLQTFNFSRYFKIHLLLVDEMSPDGSSNIFSLGLIKGLIAWTSYSLPKSLVHCILAHPADQRQLHYFRKSGFGIVKHNEAFEENLKANISYCFAIYVLYSHEEEWNNHRFHGIISY